MTDLTVRAAAELIGHEAIVLEAYLDNAKPPNWTWSAGVTERSGYKIMQYKDNPSTLATALQAFVSLLRKSYLPDVLKAFDGFTLSEAQLSAALSFHYNTGAIMTTSWVSLFRSGRPSAARAFLETHYLNDGALTDRRHKEAALFFDKTWSGDGTALVLPVSKPSYQPSFKRGKRLMITGPLAEVMR